MIDEYERRRIFLFILGFYEGETRLFIKSSSVDSGDGCPSTLTPLLVQHDLASLRKFSRGRALTSTAHVRWAHVMCALSLCTVGTRSPSRGVAAILAATLLEVEACFSRPTITVCRSFRATFPIIRKPITCGRLPLVTHYARFDDTFTL